MNHKKSIVAAFVLGSTLILSQYQLPAVIVGYSVKNEAAANTLAESGKENLSSGQQPINATRAAREEKILQDARRQQLNEKEAALNAKL